LGLGVAVGVGVAVSFGVGVTYLGDTSGISPTMSGSAVAWRLPDIGFLGSKQFWLWVRAPSGAYGDHYPITLTLTATTRDAVPSNNTANIVVMIAHQVYLPAVDR
jgi:hypothetical protein